jgi:hypothetical protein
MSIRSIASKLIGFTCIVTAGSISGQSIDDYFHSAAQLFIHGKDSECKQTIEEGLGKYPDDPKLLALKSKIEEPEKQNQQNQNQQNKNDQKKDQNKKDDKKQDPQKKDEQQSNKDQNQDKQKPEPTPQQQKQDDMKKEDAKRLIEQFSDDEKDLNKKPEKIGIMKNKKIEKDW